MRLTDKFRNSKKITRTLAAVLSGAMLFSSGTAIAAPDTGSSEAFPASYMAKSQKEIFFNEGLNLFGPTFKADVEAKGQIIPGGIIRVEGKINWNYTDLSTKETTYDIIPFYIEQEKGDLTIYAQRGGRWGKMTRPRLTAFDARERKKSSTALPVAMGIIKSLQLEKDDGMQRTMKITLDGDKLATLIEENAEPGADIKRQEFTRRLVKALRTTDVTLNWATTKTRSETTTGIDLTELMRAYAKNILDESAAGDITLSDDDTKLMKALGYYCELKSYTTYDKNKQASDIAIPDSVRRTAIESDIFQDFIDEAKASVPSQQ